jgi:hypothetical protein
MHRMLYIEHGLYNHVLLDADNLLVMHSDPALLLKLHRILPRA